MTSLIRTVLFGIFFSVAGAANALCSGTYIFVTEGGHVNRLSITEKDGDIALDGPEIGNPVKVQAGNHFTGKGVVVKAERKFVFWRTNGARQDFKGTIVDEDCSAVRGSFAHGKESAMFALVRKQ